MKPRRFFESVEKDPHEVKICWKVLHLLIFALICMNSMFGAYNFEKIVDVFNYRCILFANPSFALKNNDYDTTTTTTTTNTTNPDSESSNSSTLLPSDQNNQSVPQALIYSLLEDRDDSDEGKKVPNTDDYYVINREIYFVNKTQRRRVMIRMMHTVFSEPIMCNIVIILPLLSLTISSALMAFIMFCGRGGRALSTDPFPGSWLYVYPVLIISFLMLILYCIISKMVGLGFHTFCGYFQKYTGQTGCSRFMNYFTKQQLAGYRKLWQKMVFCEIAYPLGAVLWALQLVLTSSRILNMTDFNLRMVIIAPKKSNWSEEDEEIELASHPATTPKLYDIMQFAVEKRDRGKIKAI